VEILRRATLTASLIALTACTSVPADRGFGDVRRATEARGVALPDESEADRAALVAHVLSRPLAVDDAVRVAFIASPAVQMQLAALGLSGAEVVRAGRLANPTLAATWQSSSRSDEASRYDLGLTQNFAELLLLSARSRFARGEFERAKEPEQVDRDFAIMLHNWSLHPGTYRPDPAVLLDFDLWTFNSKVFPAIDPMVVRLNDRVRIRVGNLSMWNHPIHLHGHTFQVTGGDGDRWPKSAWRREVTDLVSVGQARDFEFVADNPGDWAFHCHMSHHTMNAMGHAVPNVIGVDQRGVEAQIRATLPGYMAMGENGMAEHAAHVDAMGMAGPANTLPMMGGSGPFGRLDMGGMFTVLKVREGLPAGDYRDPGWYRHPPGTVARRVAFDPDYAACADDAIHH